MSTWKDQKLKSFLKLPKKENRHLLLQGDIGGDVGEGEVGVGGVKGEGMVDQGVMLVCARYFATCHIVEICEIFLDALASLQV